VRTGVNPKAMAALSSGHLATDFANGALPALLPFLVLEFGLSYTLAGVVMLAWAVSSSVVQPLFGLWSDRRGAVWLLPTGLAAGGIGIGLAAAAPAYWLVLVFVVLSGLGTAAYHPEGSKFAAYASGDRRASGMSLFSIGGNLGYALGPIAATAVVVHLGLGSGLILAVPCLAVALVLLRLIPFLQGFAPERGARPRWGGEDRPRALALLLAVIAMRNVGWFSLVTFVPLYEVSIGHSEAHGNRLLALMLLSGGIGTLAAGPLADRIGRRPVLLGSLALNGPLVLVYLLVGGALGVAAIALVGALVIGTFGVTMVMGQEYLPQRIGLASGMTVGFAIGIGGVGAVAVGALADRVELESALYLAAAVPVLALALGTLLPSPRAHRPLEPELVAP
jgi:FSR family fosmidomycin resistance protein-like MFS transporter